MIWRGVWLKEKGGRGGGLVGRSKVIISEVDSKSVENVLRV